MKVLIVTRHYLEQKSGGAFASRAFIDAFASIYSDCSLIYPEHNGIDIKGYVLPSIKLIPCYDRRSKIKKALDVYRGRLLRFRNFVLDYLNTNKYDIIVLDHSLVANQLIKKIKKDNVKVITLHHNVEREYLKDNKPPFLIRWPYIYYALKAEKEALIYSDLNLTITNEDAAFFKKTFQSFQSNITCLGTFEYYGAPQLFRQRNLKNNKMRLIITGSLNFKQSEVSIIFFLKNIYPIIKQKYDKCDLTIAGRNPSNFIKSLCNEDSSISLIENPDDIYEIIEASDIYISPISGGSGLKLRVMDGLKMGLPVIAHKNSAKGYNSLVESGCIVIYNTPQEFVSALENVISIKRESQFIYFQYCENFSFEIGKKKLQKILKYNHL